MCGSGGEAGPTRQCSGIVPGILIGEGNREHRPDHVFGGQRVLECLARCRELVPLADRVCESELQRIHAELLGQKVHLGLGGKVDLVRSESTHGTGRRVVGSDRPPVDGDGITSIRSDGEVTSVGDDGLGRHVIGARIQEDSGFDPGEPSVRIGLVPEMELGGVALHVSGEALGSVDRHLHRATRPQRQHCQVGLNRQVLSRPECSTEAHRMDSDVDGVEPE